MSQYFTKLHDLSCGNVIAQLDLYNYETKANSAEATGLHTSNIVAKSYLTSLKAEADKLKTVPADFSWLRNTDVKKLCMVN